MKIAMLTNNYKPFVGGVPISIERLSNGLRELGHEVYIFAPTYENQEEEEYVIRYKSVRYKISGGIVIPNMFDKEIEGKFKSLNIDMIHVHHPVIMGQTALYLGKKYNIPVAYTYHTRYEQYLHYIKPYRALEENAKKNEENYLGEFEDSILNFAEEKLVPGFVRYFTNKCDLVFAPTNMMKEYLINNNTKTRIEVMPTGLNENYFKEENETVNEIRKKYKGDKKYLFCTVSRLSKEKNIEFIINGIKSVKDKIGNSFNTLIIGEGPEKEALIEMVKEFNLKENITFLNKIDNKEIGNYYKACDLFLFASKSETQGIVLIEAMAAKLPVVAIKASGVVDIVVNDKNGYMTNENIDEWSEKVKDIVTNYEKMNELKYGAYNEALKYLNSNIAKKAEYNYEYTIKEYYNRGLKYELKAN
ncbi:glycosyltransferase [Clostridium sp. AL.422]|uniref:glycosyltransferase n=1 Tax=Clostridium TaxID=1485 RepID=UPI00293DCFA3|nr:MULTISPECIES: glycosyltransferase [unclassified Clostridium]MDV4150545.1 glycosyltransferase [Clostridium sp. AL.422]